MRNLRIVSLQQTSITSHLPLAATAWDTSNDSVICAFGPTPTKPIIELKRKIKIQHPELVNGKVVTSELAPITSWDAPCPLPDLECDEILLMHHFADTLTTCLVLAGGDLILVREEPQDGQERIEIVGSVDVGISAAAWAPDEELLAIVTRSENLVLMSRDLEPVTETLMVAEDLQASKHVSVGWGKKETQFHGKRAKAMRDPTIPDHIDEGLPSLYEDGTVAISWRGDGAYLAINAVVLNHRRAIRVYSREGVLDSVSEPVDGLESAISWRPAGNLIASVKRSGEGEQSKLEVIFFERNGLRHGEFALRLKSSENGTFAKKVKLAWNIDSTVLAVSFLGTVQFWTMGNYHYYLKQEIKVGKKVVSQPTDCLWHPEKPLKCCAGYGDSLIDLEYLLHVNRGSTIQPYDYGIAAVVDGTILKLTPLKHAGVPPPMAFCEIETQSNITDVAVSQNGQKLAILTSTGIELCDWQMRDQKTTQQQGELRHTTSVLKRKISWSDLALREPEGIQLTQIAFQGNNDLFILAPAQKEATAFCTRFKLDQNTEYNQRVDQIVSKVQNVEVADTTQSLIADVRQETIWAQSTEGLACIGLSTHSMTGVIPGGQANSGIFQVSSNVGDDLTNGHSSRFHRASLNTKGSLSIDEKVLVRDCTSFILTDLHLIYTTAQHLLKFVHLTEPEKINIPGDTPEVDERCRSIERGAKIVTVIPSSYAVVLQMPRGNLETIHPRVLVLTGIRESLRKLEYRTAFLACQNQQVDMNILHDYLPDVFMANVKKFIDDLKKPSRVDEFLSKLKEEDVTQTLYKDTLNPTPDTTINVTTNTAKQPLSLPTKTGIDKVNGICDAFISVLKSKPGKFLQCIITAHVSKRPPDLTSALTLVSSLRQTSTEEADLAIAHLCFLTDTNRLYDAALSLYDLEVTLLVAQNAQRDPREYMPFLQNLQSLPILRRQYQIDNHLHNYSKALTSLHALEAHDEVEAYTAKHTLYTHAINLYKYSPTHLSKITTLYADHLSTQSQHSAAATLYESLGDYTQAYPLYALAHQWRESLTCATLIPLPPDQLRSLAQSLATTLTEESRDYRSAATIHTEHLSNPSAAAKLLCKGSYFADATRLLALHNLAAEIPTTIDSALADKFSEILELVADCKAQLASQVPRIQDLRIKKAEDPLAFFGGDPASTERDFADDISLAATDASTAAGSMFTRYGAHSKFGGTVASNVSRRTSKTRRKEERKRARGKKGSVYEEEYLVASVGRLVERVNGVHEEVGRLVGGLLRRGIRERAERVDEVMREVVAACERAKGEVWGVREGEGGVGVGEDRGVNGEEMQVGGAEGEYRPAGADGVFWDSQFGDGAKKEAPVIKTWKDHTLITR